MQGKIIKGIAGFYYVHVPNRGVYECKAKGVFRNKNIKPLVGDNVTIDVVDEEGFIGNISSVLERKNDLIRPAVANIDQALIIFAAAYPAPNFNLLSRFLLMMDYQNIKTIICFNKSDQLSQEEMNKYRQDFINSGSQVMITSVSEGEGIEELRQLLEGKTTALAGPSGVGKSSILNALWPDAHSETGSISDKIKRGKHTTRHSEVFNISGNTYVCDTPGFTSLDVIGVEKEDLRYYINEFRPYEGKCRFNGCIHINEPDCAVKQAVSQGEISQIRYDNYIEMYNELKDKRKY